VCLLNFKIDGGERRV